MANQVLPDNAPVPSPHGAHDHAGHDDNGHSMGAGTKPSTPFAE